MSPLPSTGVFHPDWDNHHRPTATSSMTATCTITRKGAVGALNPVTLQHAAASVTTIYTGRCRVQQRASQNQTTQFAEQTVTSRDYLVAVEWDAGDLLVDDLVNLTDAEDPELVDRVLRVTDVSYGSNQWQRDLTCEDYQG